MINATLQRNKVSKEQIEALAKQLMGGGSPAPEIEEPAPEEMAQPVPQGDPSEMAKIMMGAK